MAFGWIAAATVVGSLLGADASQSAAQTQANAANQSTATQKAMFDTINEQQAPWRAAGRVALNRIGELSPQFEHSFNASDLNANLAPNYQFQLDQGLGALKNAENTRTGYLSGNALKGINDYAQQYAGGAYQQAFQNYTANQTNIFNRLSNIAGLGQTANQATGAAGTAAAQGIGAAQQAGGAAQAAGTVGSANAITGGLNNALGWYTLPQILNGGGGYSGGNNFVGSGGGFSPGDMWSNASGG